LLDRLRALKRRSLSILLVEQNFEFARYLADHAVVFGKGRVQWSGFMDTLRADQATTRELLGVRGESDEGLAASSLCRHTAKAFLL